MNASQLIELMNRTPFTPFEIHLNDGSQIAVEHPWQVATFRNSPVCTIYESEERTRIVAFRNITQFVTTAA
jgi:hypothetical protein